jgi:hypothetical protein
MTIFFPLLLGISLSLGGVWSDQNVYANDYIT